MDWINYTWSIYDYVCISGYIKRFWQPRILTAIKKMDDLKRQVYLIWDSPEESEDSSYFWFWFDKTAANAERSFTVTQSSIDCEVASSRDRMVQLMLDNMALALTHPEPYIRRWAELVNKQDVDI